MSTVNQVPELPPWHFFRVRRSHLSTGICVELRTTLCWKISRLVDAEYSPPLDGGILYCMNTMRDRLTRKRESVAYVNKLIGDYPPRKIIGEVSEDQEV